jgi:hypothetical protein
MTDKQGLGRPRIVHFLRKISAASRSLAKVSLARLQDTAGMTAEERFLFDLEGYLIVKRVLTAGEVEALKSIADEKCSTPTDGLTWRRLFGTSSWGAPYRALVDHPKIVPYLIELLGPKFRLDHDFCIVMRKGGRDQDLHGGSTISNPDHWYSYRDGMIRCGLTAVAFCLSETNAGDGGFCCVPGSHKSNFLTSLPADVRNYQRRPHYVVQPAVEVGDAIIFTEALIHGTVPWTADHERLVLLYKYSPGHSAWMSRYYDLTQYTDLTERQKRILAPPSVGERPDSVGGT